ncbi:hypothetical protein NDU88_000462 [Pleurodeles waltl]|uniref:Uncharacterized protein n=1 Tax=Pleurodeles waltl TaxID=8319 RepID=A0AAV7L709_PLEWA|nr:hypothetical protein NDU88_000462 [Pleurodeles waltl]
MEKKETQPSHTALDPAPLPTGLASKVFCRLDAVLDAVLWDSLMDAQYDKLERLIKDAKADLQKPFTGDEDIVVGLLDRLPNHLTMFYTLV